MDKCVTTYDGEGKFSKTCAHAKLEVTRIRLPFGHVAIPDLPVYQESYQESMQLATTDVEITCACTADPGIEVCEGASIQLRFSGQILDSSGTWRTVENEVLWNGALPAGIPAGQSRTEIESVAIDRQGLGSGSYRFVVEKREQKPDEPEERVAICYTKISDARSLFYDIEFVPSAHFRNAQGYVRNQSDGRYTYALCPYTWVHPSLVDSDNNELLWYGLSLEFSLRANLDSGGLPNSKGLYITVTGDGISKEIKWSDDVIRAGARRPVKWEGYDDYVHEDEVENVTSFPQGRFSTQYAPQHVVSEGEYYYNIEGLATDTDHDFTQNDLMQKHAVTVKIIVEYELSRILH